MTENVPTRRSNQIDVFLKQMSAQKAAAHGRLIFALDATASRQPTWDQACQLQGEMFAETAKIGGLEVQLVCYYGVNGFALRPDEYSIRLPRRRERGRL